MFLDSDVDLSEIDLVAQLLTVTANPVNELRCCCCRSPLSSEGEAFMMSVDRATLNFALSQPFLGNVLNSGRGVEYFIQSVGEPHRSRTHNLVALLILKNEDDRLEGDRQADRRGRRLRHRRRWHGRSVHRARWCRLGGLPGLNARWVQVI